MRRILKQKFTCATELFAGNPRARSKHASFIPTFASNMYADSVCMTGVRPSMKNTVSEEDLQLKTHASDSFV